MNLQHVALSQTANPGQISVAYQNEAGLRCTEQVIYQRHWTSRAWETVRQDQFWRVNGATAMTPLSGAGFLLGPASGIFCLSMAATGAIVYRGTVLVSGTAERFKADRRQAMLRLQELACDQTIDDLTGTVAVVARHKLQLVANDPGLQSCYRVLQHHLSATLAQKKSAGFAPFLGTCAGALQRLTARGQTTSEEEVLAILNDIAAQYDSLPDDPPSHVEAMYGTARTQCTVYRANARQQNRRAP
jgi:hypothetical protein